MKKKDSKNNKKSVFFLFGGVILATIIALFRPDNLTNEQPQICCGETCFQIELAQTPTEREIGLMHRETLAENAGMLFIFEESDYHTFWMKNTLIPLDMIRLDENLNILDIQQADPCTQDPCPTYSPTQTAKYVLEINQGLAEKNTLQNAVCQISE